MNKNDEKTYVIMLIFGFPLVLMSNDFAPDVSEPTEERASDPSQLDEKSLRAYKVTTPCLDNNFTF